MAVKYEDVPEYGEKDKPENDERRAISARDIELLDAEVQDRERVHNMLKEFEDL